ncbi:hypothetical protein CEXT_447721 [Caerostris extrusa]|uniref:4Fe-4S ferredoxin-type domain-containing protein n=1 Tax=Caerostris extrusa TaxID=172846 RepID=A0AAV4US49_CAEEX|nr:hypothetical protein CEXT_447721 [Caerostris extrusa]
MDPLFKKDGSFRGYKIERGPVRTGRRRNWSAEECVFCNDECPLWAFRNGAIDPDRSFCLPQQSRERSSCKNLIFGMDCIFAKDVIASDTVT